MGSMSELCLTQNCVQAAANILQNLHPHYNQIDPCEDFSSYACGGFPYRWPSLKNQNTFSALRQRNEYVLKEILEGPYPQSNTSTPQDEDNFQKLVKNYNACLDEKAIEASGLGGIPDLVTEVTTRFVLKATDYASNVTLTESDYDGFADAIAYLTTVGVPVFGDFAVIPDNQHPETLVPWFAPAAGNVSDKALPTAIGPANLAAFKKEDIVLQLNTLFPKGPSYEAAPRLAQNILDFATAFATLLEPLASDPNLEAKSRYTTTVAEAAKLAPALVIDRVLAKLVPQGYKLDRMNLAFPDIYSKVSTLICKTPRSTLQAMLALLIHLDYAPYVAGSTQINPDRWAVCYAYVDNSLPWIASKFWLNAEYDNDMRAHVLVMAQEMKTSFGDRVDKLTWMDNSTKTLVHDKLNATLLKIGYPESSPDVYNATDLVQYYQLVNISDSFFANALSIRKWSYNNTFKVLGKPEDRQKWLEYNLHGYYVNARANYERNQIMIPAGISQFPLYGQGLPEYLQYGSLGYIVAHEITHNFDTAGRLWDNERRYKTWWSNSSIEAFQKRAQCFVDQYSRMPVIGSDGKAVTNEWNQTLYVNGTTTLAENVADAGGVVVSYDAWRKREARSPNPGLPGLEEFTKDQLFYLSGAQSWCSKTTSAALIESVKTDSHAPNLQRIMGVVQNSKGFMEAFKCKKREPVCEIW